MSDLDHAELVKQRLIDRVSTGPVTPRQPAQTFGRKNPSLITPSRTVQPKPVVRPEINEPEMSIPAPEVDRLIIPTVHIGPTKNSTIKKTKPSVLQAKIQVQDMILEMFDIAQLAKLSRDEFYDSVKNALNEILPTKKIVLNFTEVHELALLILDDALGLGPLEPLLADPTINDILVNGPDRVFVERNGHLELTDTKFRDNSHVANVAFRIATRVGRRVDESSPMVDARLEDGSRVNIIFPPLSLDGPMISIRKFAKKEITLDMMIKQGNISREMAMLLVFAVQCRQNILISGGTGSGKTTLLNALSKYIDVNERIITIEDAAELKLQQPHVGRLETRPSNLEGKGRVSVRDLLINALRMRPDRIIVGEIRGDEAVDMLQSMNTGHDGSLGTIHANKPRDALLRLEHMIEMAGLTGSAKSIRQMISAVNLVVQISRMKDGKRRVTSIAELAGMEGDVITVAELAAFETKGNSGASKVNGRFKMTGLPPQFIKIAGYYGVEDQLRKLTAGTIPVE